MDHGPENAELCGRRELREETGFTAGRMIPLGAIYPVARVSDRSRPPVRGAWLTPGECAPDEDEFVEHVTVPFAELERMIAADEIRDGKTVVAAYRARLKGLAK